MVTQTKQPINLSKIAPDKRDALAFVDMVDEYFGRMVSDMRSAIMGVSSKKEDLETSSEEGLLYPYRIKELAMDTAGVDVEVNVDGDVFAVMADNYVLDGITVKLDDAAHDAIPAIAFNPWHQAFSKMYVSYPAQPGRKLWIAIGKERKVQIELQSSQVKFHKFKTPELIYSGAPRAVGTFLSSMSDCREQGRILLFVVSSLDVAVTAQALGNYVDDENTANLIGAPAPVGIGGSISIGLAADDWHPYVGAQIVCAVAPTAGSIAIYAVEQE